MIFESNSGGLDGRHKWRGIQPEDDFMNDSEYFCGAAGSGPAERGSAERGPAERGQAESGPAERGAEVRSSGILGGRHPAAR